SEPEAPQKPEEIEAPAEEKLIEAVEKDGKTATSPSDKAPLHQGSEGQGKWYIVHTYSGHENKVAKSLRQRIESMGFENRIFDIIVPTRDTVKVSGGKKENVKEKIFPGYVLIKMILDDESWLLVRTTQGVTAFIGTGNKPTPISDKEVEVIQKFMATEQPLFKAAFTVGEAVKIVDGPFSDFLGAIDSIDEAKGKLKVLVSIFGRETPVELDFLQVTKL
ncbi:MAG: transcription termination/antitermination protein NusG, partial [Patescibacteria group bacterium]